MSQPASLFRLFIVLSVVLSILGAVFDGLFPSLVPEAIRQAHEASLTDDFRVQDFLVLLLGVPLIIVGIVNILALYRFRRWAQS